jgi:hypothetical protein
MKKERKVFSVQREKMGEAWSEEHGMKDET